METSRKSIFLKALMLWVAIAAILTWFLVYFDFELEAHLNWVAPVVNIVSCLPLWEVLVIQTISCIISGAICVELVYRSVFDEFERDRKYLSWSAGAITTMLVFSYVGLYLSRSGFGNTCT